jgi:hypothetical protein
VCYELPRRPRRYACSVFQSQSPEATADRPRLERRLTGPGRSRRVTGLRPVRPHGAKHVRGGRRGKERAASLRAQQRLAAGAAGSPDPELLLANPNTRHPASHLENLPRRLARPGNASSSNADGLHCALRAAARTRGVAAGRSAQRACERSSDWRRGAAGSPDPENLPPDPELEISARPVSRPRELGRWRCVREGPCRGLLRRGSRGGG